MSPVKIAIAAKSDSEQLLNWFKHYGVKELIKKRVDCYQQHNFTIVAKDQNKIVGVLQWHIKEDPNDGVVEIEEVFVSEKYRGQGIGSMLVEFAVNSIKIYFKKIKLKPKRTFLFVGEGNIAARGLYEKFGFKYVCSVGNLFSDNEAELFYIKNINS